MHAEDFNSQDGLDGRGILSRDDDQGSFVN